MTEYTGRVAANVIWVGDRLLVAKRVSDGTWEFVGGKEEYGRDLEKEEKPDEDSIKKAALEELEEELDIYAEPRKTGESYPSAAADLEIIPVEMEYLGDSIEDDISIGREHSEYRLIRPGEIDEIDQRGQRKCLEHLEIINN